MPVKTGIHSVVFDMGVHFEQDRDDPDPQKQRWYCMGSRTLRGGILFLDYFMFSGGICIICASRQCFLDGICTI